MIDYILFDDFYLVLLLDGVCLIEVSVGIGKIFILVMLFICLVVEKGWCIG